MAIKPSRGAGQPKRDPYVKKMVSLSLDVARYLDTAWRTYVRRDGTLARGASGMVEDLVALHRDQSKNRRRS